MTDAEKTLGFAGFTRYGDGWQAPTGEIFDDEPDTTDMTWLFRWCVPKIYGVKLSHRPNVMNGQWCAELFNRVSSGRIYRTTPGEALRAAIVSLIDSTVVLPAVNGRG